MNTKESSNYEKNGIQMGKSEQPAGAAASLGEDQRDETAGNEAAGATPGGDAGLAKEKKKIPDATISIDSEGCVVFRVHLSRGPYWIIGFLEECKIWARQYYKEVENQQKEKMGLINPNKPANKGFGFGRFRI